MEQTLGAILPFFAIVVIGWLAARRGLFDEAGLGGLNAFIFNIALPPLLFRVMSRAPAAEGAWSYIALYGAATLLVYLLAELTARAVFGLRGQAGALFAHLASNGNVGFLGLPLAAAALGAEAALPTVLALTFDIIVIMSLTTLRLELGRADGAGASRALLRVLLNPILLSVFAGALWGALGEQRLGLALAEPIARLFDTLGQAAAPAALFATGATLAHKTGDRRVGEIGALTLLKLALHPLAVVAAFLLAGDASIAPVWIAAAVLTAACPSSNNAVVLAGVFRAYEARASATVLITTALGVASYAVIAALL